MIRIVIAAEIRMYRDGLVRVFREHSSITVIGTAANAEDLVQACAELTPDVTLLDWAMHDCLSAVRALAERAPEIRLILLACPEREDEMLACAEAGVCGYASRETSLEDLTRIIMEVASGQLKCSPVFAGRLIRRLSQVARSFIKDEPAEGLTSRELEVLQRIEQGFSNKQIAVGLGVEVTTVKNHVHHLLDKLSVQRRGEAAAWYRRRFVPTRKGFHSA